VVIIDQGKIVADDRMENLKQAASKEHLMHMSFLQADYGEVENRLGSIDGISGIQKHGDDREGRLSIRLSCRSDADLREAVYREVKQTDWVLIEFYQETKTLETIFRELTKEN
jgi:ABC-2 type transport system ATP-binding protein